MHREMHREMWGGGGQMRGQGWREGMTGMDGGEMGGGWGGDARLNVATVPPGLGDVYLPTKDCG